MHIHVGLLHALITFGYVLAIGIPFRIITLWLRNTRFGQAMSFAY